MNSQAPVTTPVPSKPVDLVNICKALWTKAHHRKDACFGCIVNPLSIQYERYEVYPVDASSRQADWSAIPLRDLLTSGVFKDPMSGPSLSQQLHLATTFASSVLQLHSTPWLPNVISSSDFYFLKRHGSMDYDRVYVAKQLPDHGSFLQPDKGLESTRLIKSPTMFSLGVLLIELLLCETLDSLCLTDGKPASKSLIHPLLRKSTSDDVLHWVEHAGTDTYGEVVSRCLKCNFSCLNPDLQDERFRDEVYSHIVGPLEKSLQDDKALASRP
ncbi:hypothetical protein F4778DRAFT_481220 [Xylariomycetidae sp. FL2044]|nr:hypothetical protein F4778DRAFT_481220 [Xylariomycetidae sp. FL2044]